MKKTQSIYYKNFLATSLLVFISFLIFGSVFTAWSYRLITGEKRGSMSKTASEVSRFIATYGNIEIWDMDTAVKVKISLTACSYISGFDMLLTDASGMVVACSDNYNYMCDHQWKTVSPEILDEIGQTRNFSRGTDLGGIYSELRYVVGIPVKEFDSSNIMGYIFISSDTESLSEMWRQSAGIFVFVAIIVVCLTFIMTLIATKKQAEPLNEMAKAAHRFARGDFDVRVDETDRCDEIGQLAEAFNVMADSLQRSESLRREFIANVSHELKTPMTTISGFADGIIDGTIPPEKERDYLQVISSETHRLSRLVRSMLDMSQLQAIDSSEILRRSFDASEVIRVALLGLEKKITDRGLDVNAELPEEPVITRGDKDSITQVVYNLIDNAAKFASPGSTLDICLWKQGQRAYVSVANKGSEIPKDELPLIFDRFHKSDRSRSEDREGVGLGLYIVKTILDNHNEDIYVTSCDGVTKFVFTLTIIGK